MLIFALSGKIGSGKDAIASAILNCLSGQTYPLHVIESNRLDYLPVLQAQTGWEIKKFAYKLKQIVAILTGCTVEDLEDDEFKSRYLPEMWNREIARTLYPDNMIISTKRYTYREVLQILGTELLRNGFHNNVHTNAMFADIKEESNWLITDLRFKNELESVKSRNGISIRVERFLPAIGWYKRFQHELGEDFTFSNEQAFEFDARLEWDKNTFLGFCSYVAQFAKFANRTKFMQKHMHQSEIDLDEISNDFDLVIKNNFTSLEELQVFINNEIGEQIKNASK